MDQRGYLFVAFGQRYVDESIEALKSLRSVHPEARVALVTDAETPPAGFDHVIQQQAKRMEETYSSGDASPYYTKIRALLASPFERTLFLDTDAHACGPLDGIFDLLDHADLAVSHSTWAVEYAFERTLPGFAEVSECFGSFNTGVMAYKRGEVFENFAKRWMDMHANLAASFTTADQPAFRAAVYHSKIHFHVLPMQYNMQPWKGMLIPSGTGIQVMHTRNPWFIRWAKVFRGSKGPMVVGNIRWGYLMRWYLARGLHMVGRRLKR